MHCPSTAEVQRKAGQALLAVNDQDLQELLPSSLTWKCITDATKGNCSRMCPSTPSIYQPLRPWSISAAHIQATIATPRAMASEPYRTMELLSRLTMQPIRPLPMCANASRSTSPILTIQSFQQTRDHDQARASAAPQRQRLTSSRPFGPVPSRVESAGFGAVLGAVLRSATRALHGTLSLRRSIVLLSTVCLLTLGGVFSRTNTRCRAIILNFTVKTGWKKGMMRYFWTARPSE